MKKSIDVAVIILNFNTSNDAIFAAKSVLDNTSKNVFICIADNGSTKDGEFEKLQEANLPNTDVLKVNENKGYANGNNIAIKYVLKQYVPTYIVIMNPDVLVINSGTIDRLLDRLNSLPSEYCGIQPMVWTPYLGIANMQTHIRMVPSYKDCLVCHSVLLKHLFKSTFRKHVCYDSRPYKKELDFEVPSGAFFIMKTTCFEEVSFFDARTFLYNEEIILGAKLKNRGYKFKFLPQEVVQHEGGKSIGSNAKRVKWYAVKFEMQSMELYLHDYLQVNKVKINLIKIIVVLNFLAKCLAYNLKIK